MFWNTCGRSLNGEMPIHDAPSPPMWVKVSMPRSMNMASVWQPMPPTTVLPSGARVEVLCGHPEQK